MSARILPLTALALLTLSGSAHAAESRLEATYQRVASAGYRIGVRALDAADASPQQRRAVEAAGARLASSLRPMAQDCESLALDLALPSRAKWVSLPNFPPTHCAGTSRQKS